MTATESRTGQGGWRVTVFMTPDGEPFFCGTYSPREPFQRLITAVARTWGDERERITGQGKRIAAALAERAAAPFAQPGTASLRDQLGPALSAAVASLATDFDAAHGGLAGAPQLPPAIALGFLP